MQKHQGEETLPLPEHEEEEEITRTSPACSEKKAITAPAFGSCNECFVLHRITALSKRCYQDKRAIKAMETPLV
nr:unnamed protein product [Digitaria exilis]